MNKASGPVNQALAECYAYLETLSWIPIDPRLRSKFGLSDIIQNTVLEAYADLERIQALDAAGRKRWLRRMLVNNLREEIDRFRTGRRDVRLEQPLAAAAVLAIAEGQRHHPALAQARAYPEHLPDRDPDRVGHGDGGRGETATEA